MSIGELIIYLGAYLAFLFMVFFVIAAAIKLALGW